MKKIIKILVPVVIAISLCFYGVYWAFFDIQRLKGQEILSEVVSPNGAYTLTAYRNNGGATTCYAVLCRVTNNKTGRGRNIYWQYRCSTASIQWIDEDTATINGMELDVWKDKYDYRND